MSRDRDRHRASYVAANKDWDSVLSANRASRVSVAYQSYFQLDLKSRDRSSTDILIERDDVLLPTGSRYTGQWDLRDAITGTGTYMMPHGVEFEGDLFDGRFHGEGVLTYPSKAQIFGRWNHGIMQSMQRRFPDELDYLEKKWKYCEGQDRRFHIENKDGLQPAGRSNKTQRLPARLIPEGCYDTGDGFYNPRTRCVTSPDGKILRIPTDTESKWIEKNCRRAWDKNVGYLPELLLTSSITSTGPRYSTSAEVSASVSSLKFRRQSTAPVSQVQTSSPTSTRRQSTRMPSQLFQQFTGTEPKLDDEGLDIVHKFEEYVSHGSLRFRESVVLPSSPLDSKGPSSRRH